MHVTLLEARSEDRFIGGINGELNLHGLESSLLNALGLHELQGALTRCPVRPRNVQRRELLRGLADGLRPGIVHTGCSLSAVALGSSGRLALTMTQADAAALEFDTVVLACGLTALASVAVPGADAVARRVLLLGDAREQFGAEPFFGFRRFNYGASAAMGGALLLAEALAEALALKGEMKGGGGGQRAGRGRGGPPAGSYSAQALSSNLCSVLYPFSVQAWRATRRWRRAALAAVALLLLLLLLLLFCWQPPSLLSLES